MANWCAAADIVNITFSLITSVLNNFRSQKFTGVFFLTQKIQNWDCNCRKLPWVLTSDSRRCMTHLLLSELKTIFLIMSLYVKSQSIASTSNTTFWWAPQTQTEWVIFEPARTHHLGLKAQNFESPIFTFRSFSLKAVDNSCKLQILLQVTKFFFMHFFTHISILFHFRHLPTEIIVFVCYQMRCSSGDSFSFFSSRFC